MANPRQGELFSIQSLRGIAAAVVVLNHAQLWQAKYFHHVTLLPQWLSLGESGVDLFFVISGFIMMYVTPGAFRGWRDQLTFLTRRFFRIYPVLWGITIPLIFVWLVNPKLIANDQGNRVDVISSLLLIPNHLAPILVVAWTLVYEVYFYFVASFIFYCGGSRRIALAAVWAAIIAASYVIHPQLFESPWLNVWLSPLSLEFISGMVLAHIVQLGTIRISSGMACCLLGTVLLFSFSAGLNHGRFWSISREPVRLLVYGLPAFVVLWVVLQMEIRQQWSWIKKIAWLGDRSYSLYLLHVPVLASLLMLASKWMTHSSSAEVFGVTLAVVCSIMIPVEFFYQLVEKPSHALAKRLALRLSPR